MHQHHRLRPRVRHGLIGPALVKLHLHTRSQSDWRLEPLGDLRGLLAFCLFDLGHHAAAIDRSEPKREHRDNADHARGGGEIPALVERREKLADIAVALGALGVLGLLFLRLRRFLTLAVHLALDLDVFRFLAPQQEVNAGRQRAFAMIGEPGAHLRKRRLLGKVAPILDIAAAAELGGALQERAPFPVLIAWRRAPFAQIDANLERRRASKVIAASDARGGELLLLGADRRARVHPG